MDASRSRSSPRRGCVLAGITLVAWLATAAQPAHAQVPVRRVSGVRYAPAYSPAYGYRSSQGYYAQAGSPGFTPALHRGIMNSNSPFAQSPYTDDWSTARYLPYPKPWMGPR